MSDPTEQESVMEERPPVGNLVDFVVGVGDDERLDLQVAIKENGLVIVFHSHPFKAPLAWFEFNLSTNKLDFVLDDGNLRDLGLPLPKTIAKHMQNAHQILMIQMDPKTGESQGGLYVPLIIHRD